MPVVFFSSFLKSKYLAVDFSPLYPTASLNYCGVFISLTDINQFCRKTALPNRQAPLLDSIWYCQWQSPCESLRDDAFAGRTWEAIGKYFPWPGKLHLGPHGAPSGLNINKALSAFQRRESPLAFLGLNSLLCPSCLPHWSLSLLAPFQATSFLLLSFKQLPFLLPAAAEKLHGPICPPGQANNQGSPEPPAWAEGGWAQGAAGSALIHRTKTQ